MAFYKKVKQKGDDKWHPRAVTKGHPYTTDEIARLLSEMSTVTPGDTYAVLMNLGEVLGKLMSSGHSVKLKGIGTFYYTCRSEGTGVDTLVRSRGLGDVYKRQHRDVLLPLPFGRHRGRHPRRSESGANHCGADTLHPRILPRAMRTSDGTHPPLPAYRMGRCRRRGLMSLPVPYISRKKVRYLKNVSYFCTQIE